MIDDTNEPTLKRADGFSGENGASSLRRPIDLDEAAGESMAYGMILGPGASAPKTIASKISAALANPAYLNSGDPLHLGVVLEVQELFEQAAAIRASQDKARKAAKQSTKGFWS